MRLTSSKRKNYGWPIITYGINYSGTPITDITQKEGLEQPLYYWLPSIAPSGMAFVTSDVYPNWKGDLFVGSLKFEYLERLKIKSNKVVKREKILDSIGRVRNVEEGPDGFLYVGVEGREFLKFYQSHEGIFSFLFLSFSSIAIHLYQQKPLNQSIADGEEIYADFCLQCHMDNGQGVPGSFLHSQNLIT